MVLLWNLCVPQPREATAEADWRTLRVLSQRTPLQFVIFEFANQGAPPASTTPAANFSTSFPSVVDTGGKFATSVSDASGKLPLV
jgi:hypothetical protein